MSDQNHTQPPRTELLAVVLTLAGFAGLALTAGGPALWPSFSGERAYSAHLITSDAEAPAQAGATQHASAWAPAASDEVALRVINETARSVCQSEARARRAMQQNVTARRPLPPQQLQQQAPPQRPRRAKPPACQSHPPFLTANASGRPAES